MVRIEYIDHATIKGDLAKYNQPPILISIGIVENMSDKALVLKSMFSATTGETKIHQLIIKSCITSIKRLETSQNEEI
jgi:hypothetical protein